VLEFHGEENDLSKAGILRGIGMNNIRSRGRIGESLRTMNSGGKGRGQGASLWPPIFYRFSS
jgi:hypothetical protein